MDTTNRRISRQQRGEQTTRRLVQFTHSNCLEVKEEHKNAAVPLSTGLRQRGYLSIGPRQWNASGQDIACVLLENAIHGADSDHQRHSDAMRPWPASMAHADLVREAHAGPAMTFLGWTWFPETLPPEWPHGALSEQGQLQPHARAQAFISRYHRGWQIESVWSDESRVRGNCAKAEDGSLRLYGGNFSLAPSLLNIKLPGSSKSIADVQILSSSGVTESHWIAGRRLELPPMTLFRMVFR